MTDTILNAIRERAQLFLDNNLKAFIVDKDNNYYFCFIKSVNDIILTVHPFKGKRQGIDEDILLVDIKEIKLYKDKI